MLLLSWWWWGMKNKEGREMEQNLITSMVHNILQDVGNKIKQQLYGGVDSMPRVMYQCWKKMFKKKNV